MDQFSLPNLTMAISPWPSLSQLLKQAIKDETGSLPPPPDYNQNCIASCEFHWIQCWLGWSKCQL